MSLLRRRPIPAIVKGFVLPADDRRVGWALTADGQPVVASEQALHLPARTPLPWHLIAKAAWHRPVLTVTEIADVDGKGAVTRLDLAEEGDLPQVVNTRVSDSVAWSNHVRLAPAGGLRIVGRRRRGMDALDWQVVYDKDTDPGNPAVRAQADQLVAEARRVIG